MRIGIKLSKLMMLAGKLGRFDGDHVIVIPSFDAFRFQAGI